MGRGSKIAASRGSHRRIPARGSVADTPSPSGLPRPSACPSARPQLGVIIRASRYAVVVAAAAGLTAANRTRRSSRPFSTVCPTGFRWAWRAIATAINEIRLDTFDRPKDATIFKLASDVEVATQRILDLIGELLDPSDHQGRFHETGGSG